MEAAERKAAEAQLATSKAADLEAAAPTTLSRDWVAALVQEMQSSTDVDDAHARATRVMQAFEAAVRGAVAAGDQEDQEGAKVDLVQLDLLDQMAIMDRLEILAMLVKR